MDHVWKHHHNGQFGHSIAPEKKLQHLRSRSESLAVSGSVGMLFTVPSPNIRNMMCISYVSYIQMVLGTSCFVQSPAFPQKEAFETTSWHVIDIIL